MDGYDRLTPQMAAHSDLAIFRRFSILNYRMLLYMQSELVEKEACLIAAIRDDQMSSDGERIQFAFDFHAMRNTKDENKDAGAERQKKIMAEVRPLLRDYSTCHT